MDFNARDEIRRARLRGRRDGQREVEIEREMERQANLERERQQKIQHLNLLKRQIKAYTETVGRQQTIHEKNVRDAQANKRRLPLARKEQAIRDLLEANNRFRVDTEREFPELFEFIKDNKLNKKELNYSVYRFIATQLQRLSE